MVGEFCKTPARNIILRFGIVLWYAVLYQKKYRKA
jgi:hypothetical protein